MRILLTKMLAMGTIASVIKGPSAWGYPVNGICLILNNGYAVPVDEPTLSMLYGKEFEVRAKGKKPKVYESEADAIRSGDDISFVQPKAYTERGPRLMLKAETVGLGEVSLSKHTSLVASVSPSFKDAGEQFAIHGSAYSEVFDMEIVWTFASYGQEQKELRHGYRTLMMESAPSAMSLSDLEDIQAKIQTYSDRLKELWGTWRDLTVEQYRENHNI